MGLPNSPEAPQPLGRVISSVKDWVGRLGEIWVEAQVIEIKRRNAPTQFLTFRDPTRDVSATITASAFVLDRVGPLREGASVVARLRPRVWERNTSLSFECLELRLAGEGELLARLEELKRKLLAEGLFEPHLKRPLPYIPNRIGLITGADSDAERDVLRNVERRWPARFTVRHVLVQGPRSAETVILALRDLDADPEVDVIVIARGGGSVEDLLSFSDEGLLRAVAAARTPVVSAIGHEQDVPLLDFVADARASTPTDAAQLVVPEFPVEARLLAEARARLLAAVGARLEAEQRTLSDLRSRPALLDPMGAFAAHHERLALLRMGLATAVEQRLRTEEAGLREALRTVRATSPMATLERGYSVLIASDGSTISSVGDAAVGARVVAHLSDGRLGLDVAEITSEATTQESDD